MAWSAQQLAHDNVPSSIQVLPHRLACMAGRERIVGLREGLRLKQGPPSDWVHQPPSLHAQLLSVLLHPPVLLPQPAVQALVCGHGLQPTQQVQLLVGAGCYWHAAVGTGRCMLAIAC